MKSPKEIKTGLEHCTNSGNGCFECPYSDDGFSATIECKLQIDRDALEYIEQLEERIAIMEESEVWIPVEERLPKESGTYLAVVREDRINGNDSQTIVSIRDYMKAYGMFNTLIDDTITHWMPLPKPPKGERET